MSSIKYLRPQSTVMISEAGVKQKNIAVATGKTNDVLLGLTVSYSDGSGEELLGVQLSDRQLEQLKQDIILHQESQNKSRQSDRQTAAVHSEPKPSPFLYSGLGLSQSSQQSGQQISFSPPISPHFSLELDPKSVVIKQLGDFVQASVSFTSPGFITLGTSAPEKLAVLSNTEKEARIALNKKFQELVYSVVVKHG